MVDRQPAAREAAEDLFFGQAVIIWARWFVILTGAGLALWSARTTGELIANFLLVAAMLALNCYLHARVVLGQPANRLLLSGVGLLDLLLITVMIVIWPGQGGLASGLVAVYYPLLLAIAFVFPPRSTAVATGLTMLVYASACLLVEPGLLANATMGKMLVGRLIVLAAVGGLGTLYWRIQRARRRVMPAADPV